MTDENRTTTANSGFAKKRVQWLIEHSTSHQLLWYIDSFVLRNPLLRKAAKRKRQVMKTFILIFLLSNFTELSYGQIPKKLDIPIDSANEIVDTSILYRNTHNLISSLPLQHLETSNEILHFRFWTKNQALDIWTKDYTIFQGLVTNFESKFYAHDLNKNGIIVQKVFYSQGTLDTLQARKVYESIKKNSIEFIPSDIQIKDWKFGLGEKDFLVEISTNDRYSFKSYWAPNLQNAHIKEAKQVQYFINSLKELLSSKWKKPAAYIGLQQVGLKE